MQSALGALADEASWNAKSPANILIPESLLLGHAPHAANAAEWDWASLEQHTKPLRATDDELVDLLGLATLHRADPAVLAPAAGDGRFRALGQCIMRRVSEKGRAAICGEKGVLKSGGDVSVQTIAEKLCPATFESARTEVAAYVLAGAAMYLAAQGLAHFCETPGTTD